MEEAGPLGTPLGLAQQKRASPEGRQEAQASSPFRTPTIGSLQSWDRRVRPRLVCGREPRLPLELLRGSQAPRRAVCGTRGSLQTMHGGGCAPSCCAFIHRVSFEEGSGARVLLKSGPGNRGRSECGPTHVAPLEFPRETGLILRCAGKAGNPFQTTQGNRLSCCDQEGRGGSEEAVPGTSVYPSREPGVSGNFWGSHEGCQGPFRPSGRNRGLPLRRRRGQEPHLAKRWEPRGVSRVAAGFSSYHGDLSLPLGLALGSPIFPSSCQGKLGVALDSLQGQRDLT